METVVIRKCDRLTNLPTSQQTRVGAYRSKKMVIAQPFFSAAPNFFVALLFGAKPFICGNPTPQCTAYAAYFMHLKGPEDRSL